MASSSSYLVNNHSEGIHKIKCKYEHDNNQIFHAFLLDIRNYSPEVSHIECYLTEGE